MYVTEYLGVPAKSILRGAPLIKFMPGPYICIVLAVHSEAFVCQRHYAFICAIRFGQNKGFCGRGAFKQTVTYGAYTYGFGHLWPNLSLNPDVVSVWVPIHLHL